MTVLRRLANSPTESLPERVDVSFVTNSPKPAAGVFGGIRFDTVFLVWTSFQVVYSDRFLLVDAPPESEGVQQALQDAHQILVTHEHPDHIGGITHSNRLLEFADRLLLTKEQTVGIPANALALTTPLVYDRYQSVAPGVAVVRAPGHTPGSQLVYIQLRNGSEILLTGDVAWHRSHFERPMGRPRISSWLMGENPEAVGYQLLRLNELRNEPTLSIVVSHDSDQLESYVEEGVLGVSFDSR